MVYNQVFVYLLDKSYDYIFDIKGECLTLFLKKYQENYNIFGVKYFFN